MGKAKMRDASRESLSSVERFFLEKSGRKLNYAPYEKIGVIVVDTFPLLGKLTALRFIE